MFQEFIMLHSCGKNYSHRQYKATKINNKKDEFTFNVVYSHVRALLHMLFVFSFTAFSPI